MHQKNEAFKSIEELREAGALKSAGERSGVAVDDQVHVTAPSQWTRR
jgi:hypothetical protein